MSDINSKKTSSVLEKNGKTALSQILKQAIEKDMNENEFSRNSGNVHDKAYKNMEEQLDKFSTINTSVQFSKNLTQKMDKPYVIKDTISVKQNNTSGLQMSNSNFGENLDKIYDATKEAIKQHLETSYDNKGMISDAYAETYQNIKLIPSGYNAESKKINALLKTCEKMQSGLQMSQDLPINPYNQNLDALDAISIATCAMENDVVVRNKEYFLPDLLKSPNNSDTYTSLADVADGRVRGDNMFQNRSIGIEVMDESYLSANMEQTAHNTRAPLTAFNFYNTQNRKITQLIPIRTLQNSARRLIDETQIVEFYNNDLQIASDNSEKQVISSELDAQNKDYASRVALSASLTRDLMLQQMFLTSNSLNRTHCSLKTLEKAVANVSNDEIQVITINDTETLSVSKYPDKKSLPLCIKVLYKLGIVNGVCKLKDIKSSTPDNQNVWCFGIVENSTYKVENRTLSDILENSVLRQQYVNTILSIIKTSNIDFEIGTSYSQFKPAMILVDCDQAIKLCNYSANNTSPLNNFTYALNKNGTTTIQGMLTKTNSLLTLDDNEYHNVSFLPEQSIRRKEWEDRDMISEPFADLLNTYFPDDKKNSLFAFYFKNTFRYYISPVKTNSRIVDNGNHEQIVSILFSYTPVVNIYNINNDKINNLPFCFHTFSEDLV